MVRVVGTGDVGGLGGIEALSRSSTCIMTSYYVAYATCNREEKPRRMVGQLVCSSEEHRGNVVRCGTSVTQCNMSRCRVGGSKPILALVAWAEPH